MERVVWKYPWNGERDAPDRMRLKLGTGPVVRLVQQDPNGYKSPLGELDPLPTLWIEHTVDYKHEGGREVPQFTTLWELVLVGTGHDIPDPDHLQHLGSAICGPFVWHVYKVVK